MLLRDLEVLYPLCLRYHVMVEQEADVLRVGYCQMSDPNALKSLSFVLGRPVEGVKTSSAVIARFLSTLPHPREVSPPIIDFLTQLLLRAVREGVSDIHLEPDLPQGRVRFRIDGILQRQPSLPEGGLERLIVRIKVLAGADIAQHRRPQEGRFDFAEAECGASIRVSILPGIQGEKVVLRLLSSAEGVLPLTALGMTSQQLCRTEKALRLPQGLILIAGPTGSGKTMTLYAALRWLNQTNLNICTLEDPIEIVIPGLHQSEAGGEAGSNLLCALLRQDPDVIMVGELRERRLAQMALQAAHTGHLVLTTLHASTAESAVLRLIDLGVSKQLLSSCLALVITQRLLRRRCRCEQGCAQCREGYRGRIAIYEQFPCTEAIKKAIGQGDREGLYRSFDAAGVRLAWSARRAIALGITREAEVARVLGSTWAGIGGAL